MFLASNPGPRGLPTLRVHAILLALLVTLPFAGGASLLPAAPSPSAGAALDLAHAPRPLAAAAASAVPPAEDLLPRALAPEDPARAVAPLPQDLTDADLVFLLARHAGIPATRVTFTPPPGAPALLDSRPARDLAGDITARPAPSPDPRPATGTVLGEIFHRGPSTDPTAGPAAGLTPGGVGPGPDLRAGAAFGSRVDASPAAPADRPPQEGLMALVLDLARRSGAPAPTAADVAVFAQLDPRVAGPTLALLTAVDQAWTLRDAAVAGIPDADQRALAGLVLEGRSHAPEAALLAEPLDETALVEAAILLLDAVEAVVIPQLQAAAASGAWPAQPLADPLGILRIGGTGDDVETMDRLLQIDARGNDTYRNNAGGTTLLADLKPDTLDYPIAVSIDLEGDDVYIFESERYSLGAAFLGVGLNMDLFGRDTRGCIRFCMGAGSWGIGLLRDMRGDDVNAAGDSSLGYATLLGVMREDEGDDRYRAGVGSTGYGFGVTATGLLWDRDGTDAYYTVLGLMVERMGWGEGGGRGWFVDEGPLYDFYEVREVGGIACNDCTWVQGTAASPVSQAHGFGNDNSGGLAFLLTSQEGPL